MTETKTVRHRNIFTKKYRCCKGKSDKAKEMRKRLQVAKLQQLLKRSRSRLMTDLIMKEIRKIGKEKKVITGKELEEIKNKVKNQLKDKNTEEKHDNQSTGDGGSVLQPNKELSDKHNNRERPSKKEVVNRCGNDSPTGDVS